MVFVSEVGSEQRSAIPVDKDNLISLQVFERYFPGAAGLMYFQDGVEIPVSFDETNTKLVPPADGWDDHVFYLVRPRPTIPMEYMNNPYYPTRPPSPAPKAESFVQWMFFLYDHMGKSTAVCVHPRFFVSFRHGSHLQFKVGDVVKMYKAEKEINEQDGIDVCVASINESCDFVLLKSESEVVERGPPIARAEVSMPFTLAGFGNDQQTLSYLPGLIHSVADFYSPFEGNARQMGPFILGTSQSSGGDSGAGVWGSRGLIGMSIACTTMPPKFHQSAISEAAIYSPKNIISPAFRFKDAYMKEINKERKEEKIASPPAKKPYYFELEGIGTGVGSFVN